MKQMNPVRDYKPSRVKPYTRQESSAKQISNGVKYAGVHIIADFWHGMDIADPKKLKTMLLRAARASQNTPLKVSIHAFSPQGITGVVLLAESHIALHTWPEIGYTAIDIFTCGEGAKAVKALEFLEKELKPKKIAVKTMKRGKMARPPARRGS